MRMNATGKKVPKIAFYMFRKNFVKPILNVYILNVPHVFIIFRIFLIV